MQVAKPETLGLFTSENPNWTISGGYLEKSGTVFKVGSKITFIKIFIWVLSRGTLLGPKTAKNTKSKFGTWAPKEEEIIHAIDMMYHRS